MHSSEIRKEIENRESKYLAVYGTLSKRSKGRVFIEEPDPIRTCFMLDRDRIIHSKSFRRLKHKSQVFIAPVGDHFRTRLTHTLEVNQIARTIGAGLNLNLDLIEAIALGHDVGHTPFAHAGEEMLDQLLKNGFKHNHNSIRVLTKVEQHRNGKGLNLTREVIDGVLNHSGYGDQSSDAASLEGQAVKISDKIAYVQHDIDDAIRAGLLHMEEIPASCLEVLGHTHSQRIARLVTSTIDYTVKQLSETACTRVEPAPEVNRALIKLRQFMFEKVYHGKHCQAEREKAMFIVERLFRYYNTCPEQMSPLYLRIAEEEGMERAVADYISGMSDAYCIQLFTKLYIPHTGKWD